MTDIKYFLWPIPFFCFLLSYFAFYYFFASSPTITPCLIGKTLQDGVQILSDNNLNARIISQKEDHDCNPGTIISQIPTEQRTIRPHQSVFLVISKKPAPKIAPSLFQKNNAECEKIVAQDGLSMKKYYFISNYPEHSCIGQLPSAGQPMPDNRIIAYFSMGSSTKPAIVPLFKKRLLSEVTSFLTEKNIKYHTIHARPVEATHVCTHCVVLDQKPLAGSLIDVRKPLTIQLYVQ